MTENNGLIFLTDIIDHRLRKEQEIRYYEEELKKIEEKLFFLRKEKELTELILQIIEQEKVVDIQEFIQDKRNDS
ncbi:MAG: hypothetical protein CBB97_23665 [Candidatus Endolissoclinum sp. TMED37]|nr:MAG: hypothetical protein CBB97_23665 [Candidatus Endolissoclinum sp. TMED37]